MALKYQIFNFQKNTFNNLLTKKSSSIFYAIKYCVSTENLDI
jgi:hypothetical protein